MPYVTSVERIAEARGEARGEAKGAAEVLLRQLRKLYSPVPSSVEDRVNKLSIERLAALGEAVLAFRSLSDLKVWLDDNETAA